MKKFLSLFLIISVSAIAGCSSDDASKDTETVTESEESTEKTEVETSEPGVYKNSEYNFKVNYPVEWSFQEEPDEFVIASFMAPDRPENNFLENFNIVIEDVSGTGITIEEYMDIAVPSLETMTNFELISVLSREVAGQNAIEVNYKTTFGDTDTQVRQVAFMIDELVYILTIGEEFSEFEKFVPTAEAFFASFEIQ